MDDQTAPVRSAKGGRPTKRTPEIAARLVEAIGRGLPATHACAAVGVSFQFFNDWRREDEAFRDQLETAISAGVSARLALIEEAAKKDWRAAAWLLEHSPGSAAEFGKNRVQHEHVGVVVHSHSVSRETLNAISEARRKYDGARPDAVGEPARIHEGRAETGLLPVG